MANTPRQRGFAKRKPGSVPERTPISCSTELIERLWAERQRISGNLPDHRRQSKNDMVDLALAWALERFALVTPIVDPLAEAMAAVPKSAAAAPVNVSQDVAQNGHTLVATAN